LAALGALVALGASTTGAGAATGAVSFLATFTGFAVVADLAEAVELICIPGAEEVLEGILRRYANIPVVEGSQF